MASPWSASDAVLIRSSLNERRQRQPICFMRSISDKVEENHYPLAVDGFASEFVDGQQREAEVLAAPQLQ
jgi:hypothetical protein